MVFCDFRNNKVKKKKIINIKREHSCKFSYCYFLIVLNSSFLKYFINYLNLQNIPKVKSYKARP